MGLLSEMAKDLVSLDTFLSSLPKEINKSNIKEIFEILRNKERPDLVKEIKNLLLIKKSGNDVLKKNKIATIDFPLTNNGLPTEMLKKILEKLDYKSLCFAMQTCRRWKEIILGFQLIEQASSKDL